MELGSELIELGSEPFELGSEPFELGSEPKELAPSLTLKLRMGSYTTPSHLPVLFSPFSRVCGWMRLRMLAMQSATKHARVCSKFDEINGNLLK
jgi:hypothetical protein